MPYTVFISHAVGPDDYPLVVTIANLIYQNGMQAFVAEWNWQAGATVAQKVESQIEASDAVLAIITPNYTRASFANQEIGYAYAKKKLIIPLIEAGTNVSGFLYIQDKLEFNRTSFVQTARSLLAFLNEKKLKKENEQALANLVLLGLGIWILNEMSKEKVK